MASIADRLINRLVGGVLNRSATQVSASAPIRNNRAKEFSSSDPFDKSNEKNPVIINPGDRVIFYEINKDQYLEFNE